MAARPTHRLWAAPVTHLLTVALLAACGPTFDAPPPTRPGAGGAPAAPLAGWRPLRPRAHRRRPCGNQGRGVEFAYRSGSHPAPAKAGAPPSRGRPCLTDDPAGVLQTVEPCL